MTSPSATLVNALIRCTRGDRLAAPVFEQVREDLGLWVMELDYSVSTDWRLQIGSIADQLEAHRALLETLCEGSSDYTLHLGVETDETLPFQIPVRLCELASACGLEIEILAHGLEEH